MSIPTPTTPRTAVNWSDDLRAAQFLTWLEAMTPTFQLHKNSLRLASADASFRRYFRIDAHQGSFIIMDAPPAQENCQPFVTVAQMMHAAHIRVPEVLAWDASQGFMLLTDLGTQTMMQAINRGNAQTNLPLYQEAIKVLIAWQSASQPDVLPPYDEALLHRELALFPDWYIKRHKGIVVAGDVRNTLDAAFNLIIQNNLAWPKVYVHRDFMPRNLMMPTLYDDRLGVLDFQDAVHGPITYDIASLMRDAFLSWDEEFCIDVTVRYWEQARKAHLPVGDDFGEFYRGVQWMGLQRHLKVAGIFARLTLRDGKPQYLADTPRFITYIKETSARYCELQPLLRLMDKVEGRVEPSVFGFEKL